MADQPRLTLAPEPQLFAVNTAFEGHPLERIGITVRDRHAPGCLVFLGADNGHVSPRRLTSPTTAQGVVATVALLALAGVPLGWATDEVETGNQLFLLALAALLFVLAVWRGVSTALDAASARKSANE